MPARNARMSKVLHGILLLLLLVELGVVARALPLFGQYYNSIFNFGDSISDTGNNIVVFNQYSVFNPVTRPPYGSTFFGHPTGRYCDGRLIIDFMAQRLGLPFVPPSLVHNGSFRRGANFAVGGATALDASFFHHGKPPGSDPLSKFPFNTSLDVQLQWFKSLKPSLCSTAHECKEFFGRSLFVVGEFGINDYFFSFLSKSVQEIKSFIPDVISTISIAIERLIKHGVTTLVIPGMIPLGCAPPILAMFADVADPTNYEPTTGCLKDCNELGMYHNLLLQEALEKLQHQHRDVTIIYADMFGPIMEMVGSPHKFGFEEDVLTICCGGPGTLFCGDRGANVCEEPSTRLFWDGVHMTEAAYSYIADVWLKNMNTAARDNIDLKTASSSSTQMREKDACWEYGDKLDGNRVKCRFCHKVINGGISRFKFHLSQIPSKGVNPCVRVKDDVRGKVIALVEAKEERRESDLLKRKRVAELSVLPKRTRELSSQPPSPGPPTSPGIIPAVVPIQLLGLEVPTPVLRLSGAANKPRPASALEAERCLAEFFFENKLDYSIADSISYRHMLETLVGQGFREPSADALRTKWLPKLKSEVLQRTQEIQKDWVTTGCSILADSWTDNKLKALINFSVSSPLGTFFLKTVDASPHIKNHRGLYDLFDEVIQEVGPDHVVQIISDRNINYGNIDKLIMQNYNTIFWSPCASFCVNSILDDFSKIDWVDRCICQAQTITRFIFNNEWVLDLTRKCMAGEELVFSGITKTVSDFLTLQSLLRHRSKLKQMFQSSDYASSPYANRSISISCVDILNDDEFWRAVEEIAAVSEPLLRVMRDVSGGKTAIGYIYESMTKVMDSIRTYYIMDEGKCKSFLDIVEQKWQVELHSPLHSAAAFLNPSIQYNPEVKFFTSIKEEFYHVLDKVLTAPDQRQGITLELNAFRKAQGMFASNIAKEARNNNSPGIWWEQYGDSAPALQHAAVRIVSQVCSTLTFQRDWSIILQSHSEKRNKVDKEALADQAYVHYNLTLHCDSKMTKKKGNGDPIALDNIDMTSPWVEDSDSPNFTQWLDRFPSALDGGDLNTRQFGGSIFGTNDNLFGL